MGPDGFGHRQEISSSETSVAIDKRESRVKIKWLALDSSYTALYKLSCNCHMLEGCMITITSLTNVQFQNFSNAPHRTDWNLLGMGML